MFVPLVRLREKVKRWERERERESEKRGVVLEGISTKPESVVPFLTPL